MFLEVFIYLVIAFGTLVLCITMVENNGIIEDNYVVLQSDNAKVKVIVEIEGITEDEAKRIAWIVRNGKYQDIYDIAQEFEIITAEPKT